MSKKSTPSLLEFNKIPKFSNSSQDNLAKDAKKLKRELNIGYKEALCRAAINHGFDSYSDFNNKFRIWKKLPIVYIFISNNKNRAFTKDQNKQLMRLLYSKKSSIKLLNTPQINEFSKSYYASEPTIDVKNGYLFRFNFYKLYDEERTKIKDGIDSNDTFHTEVQTLLNDHEKKIRINDHLNTIFHNLQADEKSNITPDAFIIDNVSYEASNFDGEDVFDEY